MDKLEHNKLAVNIFVCACFLLTISMAILGGYCSSQRSRIAFLEKKCFVLCDMKKDLEKKLQQPLIVNKENYCIYIFRKEAFETRLSACTLQINSAGKSCEYKLYSEDSEKVVYMVPSFLKNEPFKLMSHHGAILFDSDPDKRLSKNSKASF